MPLVFITGASSGIGQALAEQYARQGWQLALVARREQAVWQWAQDQAVPAQRLGIYAADVTDAAAMMRVAALCMQQQGLPDVVIANAGISVGMDSTEAQDLSVLSETLHTNVCGVAHTFHPFLLPMRQRGRGTLVGVASVAAIRGLPGHAAYCASKAAVAAYCESVRGEERPHGVRVVTLLPGFVDTPLTRGNRYPMPFLMSASAFAQRAVRAIDKGSTTRIIPAPMAAVGTLLRWLPDAWLDRLLAGRARKRRRGSEPPASDGTTA